MRLGVGAQEGIDQRAASQQLSAVVEAVEDGEIGLEEVFEHDRDNVDARLQQHRHSANDGHGVELGGGGVRSAQRASSRSGRGGGSSAGSEQVDDGATSTDEAQGEHAAETTHRRKHANQKDQAKEK